MKGDNYYQALGVSMDADMGTIKSRYRKLARMSHPDMNPGDKDKEKKFKEVSEAYEVLKDPAKRADYDLSLAPPGFNYGEKKPGRSNSYGKHFGCKRDPSDDLPKILWEVEEDIARVKYSIAFSNRMWGKGEEHGKQLYSDLSHRKLDRCIEHLRRGEDAEAKLYVDALGRIWTAMGLDGEFMAKYMKERIFEE